MAKNEIYEISHFEIPARDPDRLRKFYADVFGWKFKNSAAQNMQYWNISTGTKHIPGVNGGLYKKGSENETPVNYISTPDIYQTIREIKKAGGKITVDVRKTLKHGYTTVGTDPEGNPIGLFESMNRGFLRERGKQSQSGANRVKSSHRHNMMADSK